MSVSKALLEVGGDGVGVITIRNPPVNALDTAVWNGLYFSFKEAYDRDDVKAIVVKGADGKFCGGADIRGFKHFGDQAVDSVIPMGKVALANDFIEGGPKPSVAAIEVFALGGGLEVAMVCHARVAAPKAALGLPELQLGIIPGFGGTQRLPRLVGASKAIDMMLTSKTISSEEAKELGLIDEIAPPAELVNVARKWALEIAGHRRVWQLSLHRVDLLGPVSEALHAVQQARATCQRTRKNVVNPFKCLDVIEEGLRKGGVAGSLEESKAVRELVVTPQSKALVHAFFAQTSSRNVPGITDKGLKPRHVQKVAVVGGGLMGSGIATSLVLSGFFVYLKEISETLLQAAIGRIDANLKRSQRGCLSEDKVKQACELVEGTLDYNNFQTVDLVIEAVVEDIHLKQQIFHDLEKYCRPDCVLATNTSSIDLNIIGARTCAQNRIVGLHFFSPAHVMPLLEIVRTEYTSVQVVVDMLALAKTIKKVTIVVKNQTGFAVNRVFWFPYQMAAAFLVDSGIDPYRIDKIITEFGMPMGPFRTADLTGIELNNISSRNWCNTFPTRVYSTRLWDALLKANRLGERVGKGIYDYEYGNRNAKPSSDLRPILEESRRFASYPQRVALTDNDILEMIFFPIVNEACRVLEEGVVVRASDLDLAVISGMGFPKYRGGIVFWADSIGPEYIYSQLRNFSSLYGDFFKPSSSLERVAIGKLQVADIPKLPSPRL